MMVASPVLMQADGVLRPEFAKLVDGKKFGGGVEFCLFSEPTGQNGQKRYLAAAQLSFLGYRSSKRGLRRAFSDVKKHGQIPEEARFGIATSIERHATQYWALAILPSCGSFVATPTICD